MVVEVGRGWVAAADGKYLFRYAAQTHARTHARTQTDRPQLA